MGRAPCCDKANVKKGPWSPEEDAKLKSYIEKHGTGGNWIALPQKIGLKRCGKSCRLRWLNYLRPNIKHGGFSEEEDSIICSLYISIGSRWSIIAAQLPGRTDNDIKNYWNTKLKKKLLGKTRREGRANRRGSGITGQEPKKLVGESFLVSNQPPPFHAPELPVPTLMDPSSQLNDNTDSIKRLLSKLGGSVDPLPFDHYHHHTEPIYNNTMISSVPCSLNTNVCNSMVTPTQLDVANWSIYPEFEEMLYYNSMKLGGIDRVYDMGNLIGSCGGGASSSESVVTWENISAMSPFAHKISGDYYQWIMQLEEQCKFIEQVPPGTR